MRYIDRLTFFAFVVGLLHVLPHIYFSLFPPAGRVYMPLSSSELLYGAQVREILDGHLTIGDPQFFEHKNTFPSVFPYVPPLILAGMSMFSGSLTNGFALSDFLFPVVLFLILTSFVQSLTRNHWYSVFSSLCIIILIPIISKMPPVTPALFTSFVQSISFRTLTQPLPFYRTPNPQISFTILALALSLLYKTWEKGTMRWAIPTAILGVLLFSTYFYHATFFFFTVSFLGLAALRERQHDRLKAILVVWSCSLVAAGVYQWVAGWPAYQTLKITGGVFYARYVDWVFSVRYGFMFFMVYIVRKRIPPHVYTFLSALVLASLVCMNFQLLTGWTVQPGHWPQTTIEPVIVLILCVLVFFIFRRLIRPEWIGVGIFGIVLYAFFYQIRFIQTNPIVWSIPQDQFFMYAWIEAHARPQTVVTAMDSNTLMYVPVLTKANIFIPVEQYHYAPIGEIWDRLLLNAKLYGFTQFPFEKNRVPFNFIFELTYNVNRYKHENMSDYAPSMQERIEQCYPSLCSTLYALPLSTVETMQKKFASMRFEENPYRLDYALYTPFERSIGALPPKGTLVFASGEYAVYQIIKL